MNRVKARIIVAVRVRTDLRSQLAKVESQRMPIYVAFWPHAYAARVYAIVSSRWRL